MKSKIKKTVGITIDPELLAKVKARNLNISKICENALRSIVDYLEEQEKHG